ncbi:MAG: hypothetical protein KKC01_13625 [Gammaproteobacteria bacterium]|nr:hypothetical protein [Gammaproteobacteria bacterium]
MTAHLQALFSSPHLADALLLFLLLETALLLRWQRQLGLILQRRSLLLNAAAGAMLMLALRSVLAAADWYWLPGCLLAAGVLHGLQLWSQRAATPDAKNAVAKSRG